MQGQWHLDARALLLLADLRAERVDREAVNYTADQLEAVRRALVYELELLP